MKRAPAPAGARGSFASDHSDSKGEAQGPGLAGCFGTQGNELMKGHIHGQDDHPPVFEVVLQQTKQVQEFRSFQT